MSYQRKFCKGVAKVLAANENLIKPGNVTISIEDEVAAADVVKRQLGKMGVLALIATTGHVKSNDLPDSTTCDLGLDITVFENPKLNRATNKDAFTLTQASEVIAEALNGVKLEGFTNKIRYISMQRADADENDARMIIVFAVSETLGGDSVKWGLDAETVWGEVTHRRRTRGGTPIFEPGRDGKAKFSGVSDPHWVIELTCTVRATAPELPELGEKFEHRGLSYSTTAATIDESSEGTSTVTLSGRTI